MRVCLQQHLPRLAILLCAALPAAAHNGAVGIAVPVEGA